MKVVLVGTAPDRARLRAQMNGSLAVVGEFATLELARASDTAADAILIADPQPVAANTSFDEALTPREIQVLELLAEGLPNKAIAARLGISDQTVKSHVAVISAKLGAVNRTDAVRRAIRRGLVAL